MTTPTINVDRLLAMTLALRTARRFVASYLRLMQIISDDPACMAGKEAQAAQHALHQIDEALK